MAIQNFNNWCWPLVGNISDEIPVSPHPNSFGAIRKYDIHTGVDLFAPIGQYVRAVEEGIVTAIIDFTGEKAGSSWWNDTKAVLVYGPSGTVVYGEIEPYHQNIKIGSTIWKNGVIGNVVQVLKKDKSKPMSMLHLELYFGRVSDVVDWQHGQSRPRKLIDPTGYLMNTSEYQLFLKGP